MLGIDISNYQAGIDVPAVESDFVIVKVSDGVGWTQPYWHAQAEAVLAAGKRLGLYHWAHGDGNTMAGEADWFADCVAPYRGRAVMALDWEDVRATPYGPAGAREWLDTARARLGTTPLVYLNGGELRARDWTGVAAAGYPLWYAGGAVYDVRVDGYRPPAYPTSLPCWGTPAVFQFTGLGRLGGYEGDLDLNVSAWDGPAWDAQAAGAPAATGATDLDGLIRSGTVTHLLFAHRGTMHLLCLATWERQSIPDPGTLTDVTYILTRTGWRVKDWNEINGAGITVGNIRAFGKDINSA